MKLPGGTVDPPTHSIAVNTTSPGAFALDVDVAINFATAPAATPGLLDFIWPDAPGWLLEESADLGTWDISARDITTANGQCSVTVDPN